MLFAVLLCICFGYALFELDGVACHIRNEEKKSGKGSPYLLKTTPKKISATSHHILLHCSTALRWSNSLQVRQPDGGRITTVQTAWFEEDILIVLWNDQPSATVILNDKQFHAYHLQKAQAIGADDFLHRLDWRSATGRCVASPRFLSTMLWTSEACFTYNGNLMT